MAISDEQVLERFPRALIDHDNKGHYKGLLEKKLLINRCGDCGTWHTPPRSICPECWSENVVPTEVSGRGRVHLLTFLHQGTPAPGVDYSTPYPLATLELEEQQGLRFSATIVNCEREAMRIGMPVRLAWIERDGAPHPAFEPSSEGTL